MSDAAATAERPKPPSQGSSGDTLHDVLERMNRAREHIAAVDPHLSDTIRLLHERADTPGRMDSSSFRSRVAYALQDLEKLAGPMVNMSDPLRQEMVKMATTMPGLQNERLQELMRRTPEIQDVGLVRDIRVVAADAATRRSQDTATVRDRTAALESRARLAPLPTSENSPPATSQGSPSQESPRSSGLNMTAAASAPRDGAPPREAAVQDAPGWERRTQSTQPAADQPTARGIPVRAPGLVASIVSAMHQAGQGADRGPLDPTPTPMVDRVSRFEQRLQAGREENSFRSAEQSGRAALEALQAFVNGPGASVMNRIREAAKADPGGMAGVMSELRTGGVYADLRQQFDGAMAKEKGFAAAYERAAAATGQYAKDRTAVEAIISQRPDAEALTGRFQKLDAQIGEAAASTPGRKEGKNALEELAKKAAEIISRAVDKVKSAFSSTVRASSSPSPSP